MPIIVLVTIPQENAQELATILLQARLCACVNIIEKVRSFYWWENKIEDTPESLLIIKTKSKVFNSVEKTIKQYHPYTVPEIISLNINEISEEYRLWLIGEVPDAKCSFPD